MHERFVVVTRYPAREAACDYCIALQGRYFVYRKLLHLYLAVVSYYCHLLFYTIGFILTTDHFT